MKQAEASFLPQLLFSKDYWKDWLQAAVNAVGLTPLLAAVIGIPMARKGANRALLIGLWGGYFLFCLVFTYHIRFATYYHAQLIPIVALSFAPIVPVIARHIRHVNNRWYWSLFFIAALFLLVYLNIREIRGFISSSANIESQEVAEERPDHQRRPATDQPCVVHAPLLRSDAGDLVLQTGYVGCRPRGCTHLPVIPQIAPSCGQTAPLHTFAFPAGFRKCSTLDSVLR